jgi:hypothetical protein
MDPRHKGEGDDRVDVDALAIVWPSPAMTEDKHLQHVSFHQLIRKHLSLS